MNNYTEESKEIYNKVCDKYRHHWLETTVSQTMAMEMITEALSQSKKEVAEIRGVLEQSDDGLQDADIQSDYFMHQFDRCIKEKGIIIRQNAELLEALKAIEATTRHGHSRELAKIAIQKSEGGEK